MDRELTKAIEREITLWPGAEVEFEPGGKHPKAKLTFGGMILRRAIPGTPGTSTSLLKTLADVRRTLKQLGAEREKPASTAEDLAEADKAYRKPNEGRERRPDPVARDPAPVKESVGQQLASAGLVSREELAAAETSDVEDDDGGREEQIKAAAAAIVDGIYFGLEEDVYHAVERLSNSGIQRMICSPGDFWRDSWLNPTPSKLTEEQEKNREQTRILGRAYHCARLEPDSFERLYFRQPDKADLKGVRGAVMNSIQIGEALADYGEAKKRAGEGVVDQAIRLEDCGYEGPIWPLIDYRAKVEAAGRIILPAKFYDDIMTDTGRMRGNPEIAQFFDVGEPEVSVFWTDRYGIKMKARLDWLAYEWWLDFKSFDNPRRKRLRQAIAEAIRYNRYHVQAVNYREAVEEIRAGKVQIIGDATDEQRRLVASLQIRPDELTCWLVFQQKGGVPNVLARRFKFFGVDTYRLKEMEALIDDPAQLAHAKEAMSTKTGLHIRAMQDIDAAKREFMLYSQVYPPGVPWAPIDAVADIDDGDFNRFWLEGQNE